MNANGARARPWYREPWPWILMAGPAVVVVASLYTAWLAVRSDDGLVAGDYYQQGLAINQVLRRSENAQRLGISAKIQLAEGSVRVLCCAAAREALTLRFVNPTRAGLDRALPLTLVRPGVYESRMRPLRAGRWHVMLEQRDWRVEGDWKMPATGTLTLNARAPLPVAEEYAKGGKR